MLRVRKGKLPLIAAAVAGAIPSFSFGQNANWTFTGNNSGNWTGTWNVNNAWNPNTAFPNSSTATANFNATVLLTGTGGSGTVIINNAPVTVKAINFQPTGTNSNSFTITGAGSLHSLNIANGGTIDVSAAGTTTLGVATISASIVTPATSTIYKTGTGNLVLTGNNNFGGGSGANGLSVNGGTLIAVGANALAGLSIISTASTGVLELQGATVNGIGGVGSAFQPADGMIRATGGANTWNGNWFGTAIGASAGVDTSSTLTVNGGIFDGSDTNSNGFSKVGGTGAMIVNQMVLNGPLTVSGGTLRIKAGASPVLAAGASSASNVTVSGTGLLDLTNNKLRVNYGAGNPSPAAAIRGYIISGRNGGTWDGTTGITSSTAASGAANQFVVAYGDSAAGVVPGLPANTVQVTFTVMGDVNIDGLVNGTDFTRLATQFGQNPGNQIWTSGDLNYDGLVNGTDFTLLATHFGQNLGAPLPAVPISLADQQMLDSFAAAHGITVPEPATIGLFGLAGLGALARRSRRQGKVS